MLVDLLLFVEGRWGRRRELREVELRVQVGINVKPSDGYSTVWIELIIILLSCLLFLYCSRYRERDSSESELDRLLLLLLLFGGDGEGQGSERGGIESRLNTLTRWDVVGTCLT